MGKKAETKHLKNMKNCVICLMESSAPLYCKYVTKIFPLLSCHTFSTGIFYAALALNWLSLKWHENFSSKHIFYAVFFFASPFRWKKCWKLSRLIFRLKIVTIFLSDQETSYKYLYFNHIKIPIVKTENFLPSSSTACTARKSPEELSSLKLIFQWAKLLIWRNVFPALHKLCRSWSGKFCKVFQMSLPDFS